MRPPIWNEDRHRKGKEPRRRVGVPDANRLLLPFQVAWDRREAAAKGVAVTIDLLLLVRCHALKVQLSVVVFQSLLDRRGELEHDRFNVLQVTIMPLPELTIDGSNTIAHA